MITVHKTFLWCGTFFLHHSPGPLGQHLVSIIQLGHFCLLSTPSPTHETKECVSLWAALKKTQQRLFVLAVGIKYNTREE